MNIRASYSHGLRRLVQTSQLPHLRSVFHRRTVVVPQSSNNPVTTKGRPGTCFSVPRHLRLSCTSPFYKEDSFGSSNILIWMDLEIKGCPTVTNPGHSGLEIVAHLVSISASLSYPRKAACKLSLPRAGTLQGS